ncbi:MAG: GNAT family N-acetyltransferase [Eubacterium sp.]
MTKQEMMAIVYSQLAIDYNCKPEDFNRDGVIFTIAEKQNGRREMPFITHRLEIITMGKSAIVNVSKNMMSFVKRKFEGKSSYDILTSKFVYGVNPYYLPDVENLKAIENNSFRFELIDDNIQLLYSNKDFHNALQYDADSKRPEILASVAYDEEKMVGIACASADSKTMWQIGVDVLPEYRGNGIAVKLVNMLTIETLNRGIVPYYTTDCANINSQKVAIKSGYIPAWSHCFKTRLPKIISM